MLELPIRQSVQAADVSGFCVCRIVVVGFKRRLRLLSRFATNAELQPIGRWMLYYNTRGHSVVRCQQGHLNPPITHSGAAD
jgi:hypothetical protein